MNLTNEKVYHWEVSLINIDDFPNPSPKHRLRIKGNPNKIQKCSFKPIRFIWKQVNIHENPKENQGRRDNSKGISPSRY